MLPEGAQANIDTGSWQWPEVFNWLQQAGGVETREMYRTFNCGIGMVVCVSADEAEAAIASLSASGLDARLIGNIEAGDGEVVLN